MQWRKVSLLTFSVALIVACCVWGSGLISPQLGDGQEPKALSPELRLFEDLLAPNKEQAEGALTQIEDHWVPGHAVMLIETSRLYSRYGPSMKPKIFATLREKSGENYQLNHQQWMKWVWKQKFELHPEYASFKANLWQRIDPRFAEYFSGDPQSVIRIDEIEWGGVKRDGIPPLKDHKVINANEATWLADTDVVFGVAVNGEARAYPKRILAYHEMAKDHIGGESLCCVYCTLCGSMIVYDTEVDGVHYELGTSGFLYRSNKLMYDHATKSMWSTLSGKPVVGELVGKDIQLSRRSVVNTTWKAWRDTHPVTTVLSLDTGHKRDYSEGAAYRRYFATDDLMFAVSVEDHQLDNKESVFALRTELPRPDQLAVTEEFLSDNPIYHNTLGAQNIVLLTNLSGTRAYRCGNVRFEEFTKNSVTDEAGNTWVLSEAALTLNNRKLSRVPSHHAFWFGWYAAYPETRLIK